MKFLFPILLILALLIGKLIGQSFAEVVCDHPIFEEGKRAPYSSSAVCENGVIVTILD